MKVICPKCQFENQADSSRIVCAQCATIIQGRIDQGVAGDANGKRQPARLPLSTSLNGSGNSGPLNDHSGSLPNQNRDAYATRLGEDFDDVLDLPRPTQNNYQTTVEPSPVFDDVFTTPSYDSTASYDFSSYDKNPTAPAEGFQPTPDNRRVTQDYASTPDQEFMGWPMLPENSLPENSLDDEASNGLAANRGGALARGAMIVLAFGALSFLAYYFLWDYIAKRKEKVNNLSSANPLSVVNPAQTSSPGAETRPAVTSKIPSSGSLKPEVKPRDSVALSLPAGREIKVSPEPVGQGGHSTTPKPVTPPLSVPAASNTMKTPSKGNLTIQVGSFSDQGQADDRVASLNAAGVEARVVSADIPGKGTWYRVQIGGFGSREEANNYGNQLRSKGRVRDFILTSSK